MIAQLVLGNKTKQYHQGLSLSKISSFLQKEFQLQGDFHLIYKSSEGILTKIESDADLLGLKYMIKGSTLRLEIIPEKRENEIIREAVTQNLNNIYDQIFQKILTDASKKETNRYLNSLYTDISIQISKNESIVSEEIDGYMSRLTAGAENMSRRYDEGITFCRLIPRESIKNNKKVRFSIEKIEEPKRSEESEIQKLVNEKLTEIIPSLVDSIYSKLKKEMSKKQENPQCSSCSNKKSRNFQDFINSQIRKKHRNSLRSALKDDSHIEYH